MAAVNAMCSSLPGGSSTIWPSQLEKPRGSLQMLQVPSGAGKLRSEGRTGHRQQLLVRCAASQPDMKTQIKEMAAAERRWEQQVADGRVKSLSSKEAGYAVQLNDHMVLDVRPSYEREKSRVKDSIWVPAFDEDKSWAPPALLNKLSSFLLGGWWAGNAPTKRNERFMPDVVAQIPKSANVIVTCQKGLRSLAACEQLYKAGYRNLFWLNGGYDTAEDRDFEREGSQPLKFAGIGGVSEFLGWTDVQRTQAAKEGISYRLMLFARLVAVVVGVDLLLVGSQQLFAILHPEQQ